EVGRCVQRFAHTSCTWSYDMQNLFYHNQSMQSLILKGEFPSKQLLNAITIHPIKDHFVMKRLYLYYKNLIHDQLKLESTKIYRELKRIGQISSTGLRLGDHIQDLVDRYGHSISFNALSDSLATWKYFSQKLYAE